MYVHVSLINAWSGIEQLGGCQGHVSVAMVEKFPSLKSVG